MSEVAYNMAKALYDIGEMDSVTLREFEPESLPPVKDFSCKEIKKIGCVKTLAKQYLLII
jgi:DNA-binding transcriptional regulator YiaG